MLLGIVDAAYKLTYIDIGVIGSESDGGVFAQTQLVGVLDRNEAQLPVPSVLSTDPTGPNVEYRYFYVGDDAFPLRTYLMKPYPNRALTRPERIYNYRLTIMYLVKEAFCFHIIINTIFFIPLTSQNAVNETLQYLMPISLLFFLFS